MNSFVESIFNDPNKINYSVDICEHKEILRSLSENLIVVELGVRNAFSSCCFLMSCKKLFSFDIQKTYSSEELVKNCPEWSFTVGNSLDIEIPECDLLFIDTEHNYNQLHSELNLHHNKCKKYIVMHDTNLPELQKAIDDFMGKNSGWMIKKVFTNNNGLMVLERIV